MLGVSLENVSRDAESAYNDELKQNVYSMSLKDQACCKNPGAQCVFHGRVRQ